MGKTGNYRGIIKQILFLSHAGILTGCLPSGVDHPLVHLQQLDLQPSRGCAVDIPAWIQTCPTGSVRVAVPAQSQEHCLCGQHPLLWLQEEIPEHRASLQPGRSQPSRSVSSSLPPLPAPPCGAGSPPVTLQMLVGLNDSLASHRGSSGGTQGLPSGRL